MSGDLFKAVSAERKRGSPTRDSETGRVYPSRNETYRALAPQLGLDPDDQYGWHTLCRKFPGRFSDVRTGKPIDARGRLVWQPGGRRGREAEVHTGPQGRLVIPAALRKALGFHQGEQLSARVQEGRLILEKRENILSRLKERYGKGCPGA